MGRERRVVCKCAGWSGWIETDRFKGRFCKEILKTCRCRVFGAA